MVVTIYQMGPSPPCRAVLLTVKALGVPAVIKNVNLINGEHLTPEFLKINPQHTVPAMNDNGLVIAESRAIMEYLSDAYGKTDSLFPKNSKKRAVVSARLYFDAATLSTSLITAYGKPAFTGAEAPAGSVAAVDDALAILDKLIGDKLYLAGDQLTLADISTVVTVSGLEGFGHDLKKYKNVQRWLQNAKKTIVGYEEINQKQIDFIQEYLKQKRAAQ